MNVASTMFDHLLTSRGEHIHHGYFLSPTDSKELAQIQLIKLLLNRSGLAPSSTVLDVGCGIGGTSRHLAETLGCKVTGVTISGRQVDIANKLSREFAGRKEAGVDEEGFITIKNGGVSFVELDAEKMDQYFSQPAKNNTFDCVWISEAMSHLPNKELFFRNAFALLNVGGKLVVADWFKAEGLTDQQMEADIKPIEGCSYLQIMISIQLTELGRWDATSCLVYPIRVRRFCEASQLPGLFRAI